MVDSKRTGLLTAVALAGVGMLLWGSPSPAPAEPAEKPLLWVARAEPRFFLVGTLATPDPRAQVLPRVVQKAYEASDAVLAELPLNDDDLKREDAQRLRLSALPPEAGGLKNVLGEAVWMRVGKLVPAGVGMSVLESREPWYVRTLVMSRFVAEQFPNAPERLDRTLYDKAGWDGKAVAGLDTVPEFLDIFDSLTLEDQVLWMKATVEWIEKDKKEKERHCPRLVEAYREGDFAKVQSTWLEELPPGETGKKLAQALLGDRNLRMVGRLAARRKRKPDETLFVLVGAQQLAGEQGLLKLLAEKGHEMRRIGVGDSLEPD